MTNEIFKSALSDKISSLDTENSIIVLKGIPMDTVGEYKIEEINIESIIENKLKYFFSVTNGRKFLTYEEFLLLSNFVLEQYQTVYILNNNIYMEQYPLDLHCSEETRKGLITHFTESDDIDDESIIGDIDEVISLYVGIKEYNGFILGAYCDDKIPDNNKIVNVDLFEHSEKALNIVEEADSFIEIIEESDYIGLIKKLFNDPDSLTVRITNYTGDIFKLKDRLKLISEKWSDWTDISVLQTSKKADTFKSKKEFTDILKKYWGYDSFRDLSVYDMDSLEKGEKKIMKISQEKIISDLVEQAEKCETDDKDFRDLFVTAPTGAGKSVMFQIPAIYLAEKYNLLTIVISPLIGLMNDQVKNLELKNYKFAKTINSDISPIIKQEIMEKVADSEYHILYISPETLLSRSDVEQLIGNRTIGMIIIDEAHIVTTWGKQFRPDYWYLGDHIQKLRKKQLETKNRAFTIATFTATAIYHGLEDMYTETINSLHMLDPITYLGYVKRDDIKIRIEKKKIEKGQRNEYEFDKLEMVKAIIKRAKVCEKKALIYFPTVALIDRCYEFLKAERMIENVAIYHGSLSKEEKAESYEKFYNKEKLVMLATKAFGMGIDINDIELVAHFAPTGNVCDYVQEIGRAARREDLNGEAYYQFDTKDFKHINRLHGLSTIRKYQLVEVISKIDELYSANLAKGGRNNKTKRRNAMLLDAENFTYIFGSANGDEDNNSKNKTMLIGDNNINKVKTALLIIQKDFENKIGFSPINVRPIPMFAKGYFEIGEKSRQRLLKMYPNSVELIEPSKNICKVYLDNIWKKNYEKLSFPKFKYLLYTKDSTLELNNKVVMNPALCVDIIFKEEYNSVFENIWSAIQGFVKQNVMSNEFTSIEEMTDSLRACNIQKYKARAICEVILASMNSYRKKFAKTQSPIAKERTTRDGKTSYKFEVAVNSYFSWVRQTFEFIKSEVEDDQLYLINDGRSSIKEVGVVLGILEAIDVLSFNMIGGADSQLYIYINQIQSLKKIINNPGGYRNNLLDAVNDRHLISVKMLSFLYEGGFVSDDIWNYLEGYFLGIIPESVKKECLKENPSIQFDV